MMPEQRREYGVAPTPLHLLPRELLAEVVNWTKFLSGVAAIVTKPPPPVSDIYDSYVSSRLRRMPPVSEDLKQNSYHHLFMDNYWYLGFERDLHYTSSHFLLLPYIELYHPFQLN